jgi:acyl-homoserine-lactone acylase
MTRALTPRRVCLALALASLPACLKDAPATEYRYHATIRRTSFGVAHILADDLGSAGFGQGYAFAQDHACLLADQVLKVRSERSRFLGPGEDDRHLDSDFAYKALAVVERAEAALAAQGDDVRAIIEGYAAGFNQYLADTGADAVPGHCQGQPWLRPVTPLDLTAYYIDLGLLASGNALVQYIATAQPPGAPLQRPGGPLSGLAANLRAPGFGSNGWAIGGARSESGHGMVVANPHFPWEGELKLWESHVTVPGQLDVYGVGLMGVPGVLIGFNEHIGWTHTFSAGQRFTIYALELDPDDPTVYMYDGQPRAMEPREYTVEVRQADGSLAAQSRTLWSSHYGPILNVDPFGWTPQLAMTYRDANIDEPRLIEQFSRMNAATSLKEFKRVYEEVGGIPWVNTMAADREGNTWYIDASATPRLSQAAIDGWLDSIDEFPASALYANGLVLLDGGDPGNEWTAAPGARAPGLVPFAELPQIDRDDFVFNANDSYWLANPASPLEGFSPLHGFERVPQSPRTRMNMVLLTEQREGGASGADGKFTVEELQAAIMGNRSMMAELLREAVVERCTGAGPVPLKGEGEVDVSAVCAALAGWDGRFDPDSVGAVAWREFIGSFSSTSLENRGPLFEYAFKPEDPIGTPNTLPPPPEAGDVDVILNGLAQATVFLRDAGVPADARLGDLQHALRGSKRFPVPGGQGAEGVANVVFYDVFKTTLDPSTPRAEVVHASTGLTRDGYRVNYGSSFVMAVELGEDGPKGRAFLTYSQSDDPKSPHYRDQTALFSAQEWRPLVYSEADIAADPELREQRVAGVEITDDEE